MADLAGNGPRCAALVGPYLSGKTTLLEALLFAAGAVSRKGSVREGNTVGDAGAVARERQMSVELNLAACEYLGDTWSLIDCPGSIEFGQDARNAVMVADIAVVVCDADPTKAAMVAPLLKYLDDHGVPHTIFVNKIDQPSAAIAETVEAIQAASQRPLLLRHVPIMSGEMATGYIDLISQRAYEYKEGEASSVIEMPTGQADEHALARQELLEKLADFDDDMLEQLLEDIVPDEAEIYKQLIRNVAEDNVVPVMIGAAESQRGVARLWKSLRHDAPSVAQTAARRGLAADGGPHVEIFKTTQARTGKLSHGRIWAGEVSEGMTLGGERVGSLFAMLGQTQNKLAQAAAGQIVALGRMEEVQTGNVLDAAARRDASDDWPEALTPVFAAAIHAAKREDEVKLSAGLQKLREEDPAYAVEVNPDTNEMVLWGQGEIHLTVAGQQLEHKYNVSVSTQRPRVPYKETIRRPVDQHARHKKQSGGHGQFGDVKVEIKPLSRGSGFEFDNRIVGGAVPRQYIPSVEHGVREYLAKGPLGFPVVDLSVCLYDGQFHAVDSSDQAFRTAAAMAMREGMPKADPVLLEPICKVEIDVPSEHTSKVNTLVTGRRGQLLGFDTKAGWSGWDTVQAYMPQSEMHDLIIELRSLSQGTGSFRFEFDHLQELIGREADAVVSQRKEADAA